MGHFSIFVVRLHCLIVSCLQFADYLNLLFGIIVGLS